MLQQIIDGFDNFVFCLWAHSHCKEMFWEWLSVGWYDEYIYPYDDVYGVTPVSEERILRICPQQQQQNDK